ncbi:SusC/RagA family TonB-linked outer membrane protein [Chitinophaga rhizophila]|uniref:SusC/RagA family TonB-linked outer membrane protein n=1 Tax=Chitinophaga rhizophila TaxID=2866212 RepID=A0ABS7GMR8_9BACT|nr:SusC/RagA family TonB-linked outer membrane protein [Chitinophaga rhizophila]MBW8688304.1 SusC/RagA family TonB-linked outer membrane protein [Chitinophaga rhizophila]
MNNILPIIRRQLLYCLGVLIILLAVQLSAMAQSIKPWQQYNVKINASQQPLKNIFASLEIQTGISFNYDENTVKGDQIINMQFKGTLDQALQQLGRVSNITFRQIGNAITAAYRAPNAADRQLNGIVYSKNDRQPLPGVSVVIKETKEATTTNGNGEFSFRFPQERPATFTLIFRYIGMDAQEIVVTSQNRVSAYLEDNPLKVAEVVVTSSYTKDRRREEVVGSISQLNSAALQTSRPIESIDKMLEGMIAGVYVETNTELNTPVKVNIRGQGSLTAMMNGRTTSSQPLYVIDGIPLYEQQRGDEPGGFANENYLNPLSNINPADVKSISVLKDAAASAIYGANAANGVIIITTKGGASGKTNLNVDYKTGVSSFINQIKYLNGSQYHELLKETYMNNGMTDNAADQLAGSKTIDTDWFGLTNRNASYHNVNMDLSGGKQGTTFRLSGGYLKQNASSLANDLEKIYARIRVDHEVSNKMKLTVNLSPTLTAQNSLNIFNTVILPPNVSPYNADGSYNDLAGLNVPNPVAVLNQNTDTHRGFAMTGSVNGSYQVADGLQVMANVGADYYSNSENIFQSALNATGRTRNGFLQIFDRRNLGWVSFIQASYEKNLTPDHHIYALAGTQAQSQRTDLLRGTGAGFTYDKLRNLNNAATQTSASSTMENATVSYYSQVAYDYKKKYYTSVNVRADKSSIFGGDKQVALNSSIGLGWVISNENFLLNNSKLTFLRLRTSYGSTGNSRIGTYAARGLYLFGSNNYQGNTGAVPDGTAAPNPDLSWEKNYKLNIGLDITFLGRISVVAEYYNNTIRDMISSINVAPETGFTMMSVNAADMRNKGFELTINSTNIQRNNFTWNTVFNLGFNRGKILRFNDGFTPMYSSTSMTVAQPGISTSTIWGWKWAGVDPETGEELFYDPTGKLVDAAVINALPTSSGRVLGDRLPKAQGGLINAFTLGRFSLTANVEYSFGSSVFLNKDIQSDGRNLNHRNQIVDLMDRWQQPGDVTDVPRLYYPRRLVANSSRYLRDINFLKLSNVSVSYQLPKAMLRRAGLDNVNIYANARNLFYWYQNDNGTDTRNGIAALRFVYPEMRTYTMGVRIGL